jgi:hypothetical protein
VESYDGGRSGKGPLEFSMVERPAPHFAFHILVAPFDDYGEGEM